MGNRAIRGAAAVALGAALVVAGCGGGGNDESSSTSTGKPTQGAKRGGDLKVVYNGDVDNLDPRVTYYQYGLNVAYATQRPLFSYKPDSAKPVPDLAESDPQISADGKTLTIKLRTGVKFSPPVNRAVTSKDVKYALESGFTKSVAGPYLGAYMGDVEGLKAFQDGDAKSISGIQTPDDQTLVIKLSRPRAAIVAGMLSLPASAPVPEEYAKKHDAKAQSDYGNYQVATGPYMIANDASGKLTGYKAGAQIRLVRNPSWDAKTDYKPAYLNSVTIQEGVQPDVGSRQILNGQSLVSGDFSIPSQILAQVTRNAKQKSQLLIPPPSGRYYYIALNNRVKPFDDVNVRRAISAGMNRQALRQAFGGPLTGDIPTHYLPPGQPGYEQAGGAKGPGVDFLAKPAGDPALAAQYMKKAGFASGKYDGGKTFTAVADSATQQRNVAEVAAAQMAKLGFKVKLQFVSRDSMYSKFCQIPKNEPDICPSVGWAKDFPDGEANLGPVFNGKNILDQGNSNFTLLDDKALNAQMDKAEIVNETEERNAAWGAVDKTITGLAPGVVWLWDKHPYLFSKNVNQVYNIANSVPDVTWTSLK